MNRLPWVRSSVLLLTVLGIGAALGAWKYTSIKEANAASANQPEPMESVVVSIAKQREHHPTTIAIGTVIALRSISLRNEVAGTVHRANLTPGQIVEAGTVLVALDVSVEEAELRAQQAQAKLAETLFTRMQHMNEQRAASETELDSSRAERDVALAQVARTRAVIARKTIRAPFRARVGISDVHPGQYLEEGAQLTTLQGVDDGAYVDFSVAQQVAGGLRENDSVDVSAAGADASVRAKIVAIDSRVDSTTRNTMVRARIEGAANAPAPGASVRVRVPIGPPRMAVAVPANALRKGPGGDHVFVITPDAKGQTRAALRPVVVGAMLGDEAVIETGLAAGEQVAASGSFKLRDAALVAVSTPSAPSASASASAAP